MSWRDKFTGKGSFRGAEFYLDSTTLDAGRRIQIHEYPKRDEPYAEDMGRKAREFSFEAYCIGPDYLVQKEALIAAVEKPGSGELVHPFYGRMQISVTRFQIRETTREGGYATLSLSCIAAGNEPFPQSSTATRKRVTDTTEQLVASQAAAFEKQFSAIDGTVEQVETLLDEVDRLIGSVISVTASLTKPVSDLIRAPYELATALAGGVTTISALVSEPFDALGLYNNLLGSSHFDSSTISTVNQSPRAQQEAQNRQALNDVVKVSAIAGYAESTTQIQPTPSGNESKPVTRNEVLRVRDELMAAIDTQQFEQSVLDGSPLDDAVYSSLADLREAVVADLSVTVGRLPAVKPFTPGATLPALVIAHQLYGDASRDQEIVALNKITHPGFVQGGEEIEVLIDA